MKIEKALEKTAEMWELMGKKGLSKYGALLQMGYKVNLPSNNCFLCQYVIEKHGIDDVSSYYCNMSCPLIEFWGRTTWGRTTDDYPAPCEERGTVYYNYLHIMYSKFRIVYAFEIAKAARDKLAEIRGVEAVEQQPIKWERPSSEWAFDFCERY